MSGEESAKHVKMPQKYCSQKTGNQEFTRNGIWLVTIVLKKKKEKKSLLTPPPPQFSWNFVCSFPNYHCKMINYITKDYRIYIAMPLAQAYLQHFQRLFIAEPQYHQIMKSNSN